MLQQPVYDNKKKRQLLTTISPILGVLESVDLSPLRFNFVSDQIEDWYRDITGLHLSSLDQRYLVPNILESY